MGQHSDGRYYEPCWGGRDAMPTHSSVFLPTSCPSVSHQPERVEQAITRGAERTRFKENRRAIENSSAIPSTRRPATHKFRLRPASAAGRGAGHGRCGGFADLFVNLLSQRLRWRGPGRAPTRRRGPLRARATTWGACTTSTSASTKVVFGQEAR